MFGCDAHDQGADRRTATEDDAVKTEDPAAHGTGHGQLKQSLRAYSGDDHAGPKHGQRRKGYPPAVAGDECQEGKGQHQGIAECYGGQPGGIAAPPRQP